VSSTESPNVLDYAKPDSEKSPPSRRRQILLLVLALPALIVPFVPFAYSTSPLDAARALDLRGFPGPGDWGITLLGCGFFVGIVAVLWRGLPVVGVQLGRRSRTPAMLVATAICWAPFTLINVGLSVATVEHLGSSTLRDALQAWPWIASASFAVAGIVLAWRLYMTGNSTGAASVALTTPFLANAFPCLIGFYNERADVGYYLALYLVAVWLAEMVAHARTLLRRRGRAV
jgi:hypothetical protein